MVGERLMFVFSAYQFLDQESDVLLIDTIMRQLTNSASVHLPRPRWPIAAD